MTTTTTPKTVNINGEQMLDAKLQCTTCGYVSECYVTLDTKIGDVLDTGECDRCAYDQPEAGRKARVIVFN